MIKIANQWNHSCYFFVLILFFTFSVHAGMVINKETGKRYGDDLQRAINEAAPDSILELKGKFFGTFVIKKEGAITLQGKQKKRKNEMAVLDGKGVVGYQFRKRSNQSRIWAILSDARDLILEGIKGNRERRLKSHEGLRNGMRQLQRTMM